MPTVTATVSSPSDEDQVLFEQSITEIHTHVYNKTYEQFLICVGILAVPTVLLIVLTCAIMAVVRNKKRRRVHRIYRPNEPVVLPPPFYKETDRNKKMNVDGDDEEITVYNATTLYE